MYPVPIFFIVSLASKVNYSFAIDTRCVRTPWIIASEKIHLSLHTFMGVAHTLMGL